jgi:hypothetical protein
MQWVASPLLGQQILGAAFADTNCSENEPAGVGLCACAGELLPGVDATKLLWGMVGILLGAAFAVLLHYMTMRK